MGNYRLCVSNEILLEYEEILSVHASPQVAHNVVEAIARHPQTYYKESFYRFHLMTGIDEDDNKFVDVTEDNHFSHLKKLPFLTFKVQTLDEFMDEPL